MTQVETYYHTPTFATWHMKGEEQFLSKNNFVEIPRSHAKMHLKSAPQKLNFIMAKAISKCYTIGCSSKCPSN